jgi:hypothetical protein
MAMKTKYIIPAIFFLLAIQAHAQRVRRPHAQNPYIDCHNIRPMHRADFDHLYETVSNQASDSRKIRTASFAIENNLMTAGQISLLLSLLSFERYKLELAKTGWLHVYDPGNYFKVLNLFLFNSSAQEMQDFMSANPRPMPSQYSSHAYNLQTVAMHPARFREAKATVAAQAFDDSKLQIARQIAATNMLSSQQLYELMALFAFEDTRLELAIFAYCNVYDPDNYFFTHKAFSFNSSVERLDATIFRGYKP